MMKDQKSKQNRYDKKSIRRSYNKEERRGRMEIKIFNSKIAGFLKIRVIIKTKKSKRNDKKSHGRNGYI